MVIGMTALMVMEVVYILFCFVRWIAFGNKKPS